MPRTRSSRVLWLLAELGAPAELVKLAPEERRSAAHLARHPLGRVPALELEAPLYRWIREIAEESPDAPAGERFAAATAGIETALHDRDWLLGDRFTVADVICASVLGSAHSRGLLERWPGLQAYVERGEARPAFVEAAVVANQPRT
jgi:glutathione S-transferase